MISKQRGKRERNIIWDIIGNIHREHMGKTEGNTSRGTHEEIIEERERGKTKGIIERNT